MASPTAPPIVHRLLLDAVTEFPYAPTSQSRPTPSHLRQSTASWSQTTPVARALTHLTPAERTKILKFYHPRDAALSLASTLLKHLVLARHLHLPWSQTPITQERHLHNGRPFFAPGTYDFNVSHHGSLAVLAGCPAPNTQVGIDVVHVNLEKDARDVRARGWRAWSAVFADAFAPAEVRRIADAVPMGDDLRIAEDEAALVSALRVFYAHWALKEAYIKMTSEAFMADWLRELEFRNVRVPNTAAPAVAEGGGDGHGEWADGETVRDIEVWLRGERVRDVHVELQAVGKLYMVATVANREVEVGRLDKVTMRDDIDPLVAQDGGQALS